MLPLNLEKLRETSLQAILTDGSRQNFDVLWATYTKEQIETLAHLHETEVDALIIKIFRSFDSTIAQALLNQAPALIQALFVHRAYITQDLNRDASNPVWGDILLMQNMLIDFYVK